MSDKQDPNIEYARHLREEAINEELRREAKEKELRREAEKQETRKKFFNFIAFLLSFTVATIAGYITFTQKFATNISADKDLAQL
jgi:hypothetical protein